MFRGVSKAIPAALAITIAVCAPAHAGPIWGAWDAAAADPRPLYLATTAAPDAGPSSPDVVRETQDLLAALGYRPGPADGVWGRRTASAFRAFLRDAGLPAADSLTPDALRALRRLAARPQEAADRPAPPTPPPPPEAVREAQDLLAALGYRPDPADGIWGGRTASAFRAFLRDAGLPAADSLTPDTLRALRRLAAQQAPTAPISGNQAAVAPPPTAPAPVTPHGDRYVGNWRNGKMNGQGTLTWPDGGRYVGNWRDDKPQGWGAFTDANGNNYVGEWSRGCYKESDDHWAAISTTRGSCGF